MKKKIILFAIFIICIGSIYSEEIKVSKYITLKLRKKYGYKDVYDIYINKSSKGEFTKVINYDYFNHIIYSDPFLKAINENDLNKIKELLHYGYNFYYQYSLSELFNYGSYQIIEYLISNGLDINKRDNFHQTMLFYVLSPPRHQGKITKDQEDRFKFLLKKGAVLFNDEEFKHQLLISSILSGSPEVLGYVLKKYNLNINKKNAKGNTIFFDLPLDTPFFTPDTIENLIINGFDLYKKNNEGKAPIDHLYKYWKDDFIDNILIKHNIKK